MSHHIKPTSVNTYLSGICQQLEPFFPDIRKNHKSVLVHRTIGGCKHIKAIPTKQKSALTVDDLFLIRLNNHTTTFNHDNLLFHAQLVISFFALLWLGELTYPDNHSLQNPQKITKRILVLISENFFQFFLPGHKAKAQQIFWRKFNCFTKNQLIPYSHLRKISQLSHISR